ncbi:MAG: amidohydrolase [Bacillota bacterium]
MAKCFINGVIRTMDPERPWAKAVAVSDGRFTAVGSNEDVLKYRQGGEVVDLRGRFVLPGLIDAHAHLLWFGQTLTQLDLSDCDSLNELRRRIAQRVKTLAPGEWLLGWGWHQERFAERENPTRFHIDDLTPVNPVYLARSCTHTALVNKVALDLAGIGPDTPDPSGGRIVRDESGDCNGLLHETAMQIVLSIIPPPTDKQKEDMILAAMQECLKYGITSVHSIDAEGERLCRRLQSQGRLPLRVYLGDPVWKPEDLAALNGRTGEGDDWLRTGPAKLWQDGAFGPRTAALSTDYSDDPGNCGFLVHEPDILKSLVVAATRAGRQLAIHALGDLAMETSLDAIEAAMQFGARRPRIVHCGVVNEAIVARMKRLRVIADMQPCFIPYEVDWMPKRLGPDRELQGYAIRTLKEAGICCTAGSDVPVDPVNPMIGIYGAVTRAGLGGLSDRVWNPRERVSVDDALTMFTVNGAFAEFAEDRKGKIQVGYLADMVVLSDNLYEIAPMEILSTRTLATFVGGETGWCAPDIGV